MIRTRVLRASDYPCMPWKNGGGSTQEVTRDSGQGLEGFGWRLSIADIDASGDFSRFSGYQRIITVLQGAGMVLTVDGLSSRALGVSDPFIFAGDSQTSCTLLDGPIRDINLIYAASRFAARLHWLDVTQPQRLCSPATTLLLFNAGAEVAIDIAGEARHVLGLHDCLRADNLGTLMDIRLQAPGASHCCLIELTALCEP